MLLKLILFLFITRVNSAVTQLEMKDCVACIMSGKHWCGQYTSPFKKTICNYSQFINPNLCRSHIGIKVNDCESPVMNPPYPGRNGPKSLWDTKCTKTITLGYDKGKDLIVEREETHTVGKRLFCLVTVNNLSGST